MSDLGALLVTMEPHELKPIIIHLRTLVNDYEVYKEPKTLDLLNNLLVMARHQVEFVPAVMTITYLRTTFSIRNELYAWQPLLTLTHIAFHRRWKPYYANAILRGLDQ